MLGAAVGLAMMAEASTVQKRPIPITPAIALDLAALKPWALKRDPRFKAKIPLQNGSMQATKGFLFRYPAHRKAGVILCLHPKAGSSGLLALLELVAGMDKLHGTVHHIAGSTTDSAIWRLREDESPYFPRITIVRNPYSRLLSGFLNKMDINWTSTDERTKKLFYEFKPERFRPGENFSQFVRSVVGAQKLDKHFMLQSRQCNLYDSVWDYALHIEDIDIWFRPLMRLLGIYNTTAVSSRLDPDGNLTPTNVYGADNKITDYYTPELARTITSWAAPDLRAFNYPPWNRTAPLISYYPGYRSPVKRNTAV